MIMGIRIKKIISRSWTRDDEIAELDREIERKQSRLKEIYEALGQ